MKQALVTHRNIAAEMADYLSYDSLGLLTATTAVFQSVEPPKLGWVAVYIPPSEI